MTTYAYPPEGLTGQELSFGKCEASQAVTAGGVDLPGATIVVPFVDRPVYVTLEAVAQIGLGSGAAGGDSVMELRCVDTSDGSTVFYAIAKAKVPTAGNVQFTVSKTMRLSQANGTVKTYKFTAIATALPVNTSQIVLCSATLPATLFAIEH